MKKTFILIIAGIFAISAYLAYSNYSDWRSGKIKQSQDRRRAEELEKRKAKIRRVLKNALNPNFTPPEVEA